MRWPRRPLDWRAWLKLDTRQKGRNFLWHLHSIVGTWLLLAYLVMSLSGLWWSYDWYRDGLNRLAGVPQQSQPRAVGGGERGKPRDAASARTAASPEAAQVDVAAAWLAFEATAPAWSTATLQWPRDGGGVQFRYLDASPPHERANNQIELDATTLAVTKHERYEQKPAQSCWQHFALHRGVCGWRCHSVILRRLMPRRSRGMLYLAGEQDTRGLSSQDALSSDRRHGDRPWLVTQPERHRRATWPGRTAASLRDGHRVSCNHSATRRSQLADPAHLFVSALR